MMDPNWSPPTDWSNASEWADAYRRHGIAVVPAKALTGNAVEKRPQLAQWRDLQENGIPGETHERWYDHARGVERGNYQMGMICGRASTVGGQAVFAIDLDVQDGKDGIAVYNGWLVKHNEGEDIETARQRSGGGGRHVLFKTDPDKVPGTGKSIDGVDIRGQGGFLMLAPSRHSRTDIGWSVYAWEAAPWDCEIAEAPDWLLEECYRIAGRDGGPAGERQEAPRQEYARADDAFGMGTGRVNDGREQYMRDMVFAAFVSETARLGRLPTETELFDEVWPVWDRKVDWRAQGKERGPTELRAKVKAILQRFAAGGLHTGRGETLDSVEAVIGAAKSGEAGAGPGEDWSAGFNFTPGADTGDEGPEFKFETIDDLRKLPQTKWLAKGWIPERSLGIFYGKWATGKSFATLDLALSLAYGFPDWHGAELPGEECDILVVAREGAKGFVDRIDAFKKLHGIADDTTRIVFLRGQINLMDGHQVGRLFAAIKATGKAFKLALVDTVARVMPGMNMSEPEAVTLFMERLQSLGEVCGGTAIAVHHQNKSGEMMGSTFFEANSDFVFEVTRSGDEQGPLSAGEIRCTKMKDGEDQWVKAIEYEKVALCALEERSSLAVKRIGDGTKGMRDEREEVVEDILSFLRTRRASGTMFTKQGQGNLFGALLSSVLRGRNKGLVQRTIDRLYADGVIGYGRVYCGTGTARRRAVGYYVQLDGEG